MLRKGFESLGPKAKILWPFWETVLAQEKWGKQVTNTGIIFEHDKVEKI